MEHCEQKAFELLYAGFYPQVFQYVRRRVGNLQEAEDLTQEIFLSSYKRYNTYDPQRCPFSCWIFIITKNRLKNYYRDHKSNIPLDSLESILPESGDMLDQAASVHEMRLFITKALKKLSKQQQEIVVMRYFHDSTILEIAEKTGLSPGNVRTVLCRSLKRMQNDLAAFKAE